LENIISMSYTNYGYDQWNDDNSGVTDMSEILDNRAYRTGEIHDTQYPLSEWRGGYGYEGSGYPTAGPPMRTDKLIGDVIREQKARLVPKTEYMTAPAVPEFNLYNFITNKDNLLIILIVLLLCVAFLQYSMLKNYFQLLNSIGLQKLLQEQK
jgi:hypothetical protein